MARKLKDYPSVALKPEDLDGKIDFVRIFGRSGPVHIEVGSGKGTFLLNQARAQPQVNFLGIEWAGKYYRYAVDRIGRWGLSNVRIIRTDAATFLADFPPDNCADCFYIYFPDPWPKKRHHKRRFFCPANLEHLLRCLKTGGNIKIATDHAEYFRLITELMEMNKSRLEPTEFLPAADPAFCRTGSQLVGTNFERKYLKEQRPIYTIAVRKIRGQKAEDKSIF
jgi:tRNA (guanine-N7-)-methyltransferase